MTRLENIRVRAELLGKWLLGVLLVLIVIIELLGIVGRYLPAFSLYWTSEVLSLALLSLGWIGAGYLWSTRGHLTLSFTSGSPKQRRATHLFTDAFIIVIVIGLIPSMQSTLKVYSSLIMPASELPASLTYLPMVMGLGLLVFGSVLNLLIALAERRTRAC